MFSTHIIVIMLVSDMHTVLINTGQVLLGLTVSLSGNTILVQ